MLVSDRHDIIDMMKDDQERQISQLTMDPETGLESLFSLPMVAGVGTVLYGSLVLFLTMFKVVDISHLSVDTAWAFILGGLLVATIGRFVRSLVDDHLVIDFDRQEVRRYLRIGSHDFVSRVCHFSEAKKLVVDRRTSRKPESPYDNKTYHYDVHQYGLKLVLKRGWQVRLRDRNADSFSAVHHEASYLGERMGLPVSGDPGGTNRSKSAFSSSSVVQGCGLLLALSMAGNCNAVMKKKDRREPVAPSQPLAAKPSIAPSDFYVQQLRQGRLKEKSAYFESGVIILKITDPAWTDHLGEIEPMKSMPLGGTLLGAVGVVETMRVKLGLPKAPMNPGTQREIWKEKLCLRVVIGIPPDPKTMPILQENLRLGFHRMALGSPRNGKAMLALIVSASAKKPEVRPEKDGFSLIIPARYPIDPKALGLPEDI